MICVFTFSFPTNQMYLKLMLFLIIALQISLQTPVLRKTGNKETVVRIRGGPLVAELLAIENGFLYKGPVLGFENTYIFIRNSNGSTFSRYRKRGSYDSQDIRQDERILWAEEQHIKQRQKRDFQTLDPSDIPKIRVKRIEDFEIANKEKITKVKNISTTITNRRKRYINVGTSKWNYRYIFNDELWKQQWYLRDTRTSLDLPKLDLNVIPVYAAGITGKGVRISILDDGIEFTHEDLNDNFDPIISYNCNEENYNILPTTYNFLKLNSHGTRCAGEIAMIANNGKCGVGVAFNAKIGGVKMLDGDVTDRIEGSALSYAQHLVDIYSASWGPSDDGTTVDGPGRLATEAIENGIKYGRQGKGAIYVWASGNGGKSEDNCNCDGYLNSPYTITIGSVSQKGQFPWYGEACASTLAVTYSSGAYSDQMITTTDLYNKCTTKHTGTSASAPLAAGIIALALEANPSLTWRDIQHLLVWTSEISPLIANSGWQQNSFGLWFNTKFGFGLINAFSLVSTAANWTTVPEYRRCIIEFDSLSNTKIWYRNPIELKASTEQCAGTENEVIFLEHVQVETSINYTIRGALDIKLISPTGTRVQILAPRKYDDSTKGFVNWKFLSVMTWGELASGIWTLQVHVNVGFEDDYGTIGRTRLILSGTTEQPRHMAYGSRNYNDEYNKVHYRAPSAGRTSEYEEDFNFLDEINNNY